MSFEVSLRIAERHDDSVVGLSHASSVIPVVRSSEDESRTVTQAFVPLKDSAPPYLPAAVQVALASVPLLFLPDVSFTAVPDPSLNEYAATRPARLLETVTETPDDVVTLLPASV